MEMREQRDGSILVKLSADEESAIGRWTHERRDAKRAANLPTNMISDGTFDRDRLGILAEYVTATALGLRYEPRPLGLRGNRDYSDVLLPQGGAINAQYRSVFGLYGYALYGQNKGTFRTAYGVLVIPASKGQHEIVGYISRAAFNQCAVLIDMGRGKRWTAPRSSMRPLKELLWTAAFRPAVFEPTQASMFDSEERSA